MGPVPLTLAVNCTTPCLPLSTYCKSTRNDLTHHSNEHLKKYIIIIHSYFLIIFFYNFPTLTSIIVNIPRIYIMFYFYFFAYQIIVQ